MTKRKRMQLGVGMLIILGAVGYIIFGGLRQAMVYFFTPQEILAKGSSVYGRSVRIGGVVKKGSLVRDPKTLQMSFVITDGVKSIKVFYKGIPPDLFGEDRGAVVEGTLQPNGTFLATTIMAKHTAEYSPHKEGTPVNPKEIYKTLMTGGSE